MNKQNFKRLTLGVTAIIALVMMLRPDALSSRAQELSEDQTPEAVEQQADHIEEPKPQDIAQESNETSDALLQEEESQAPSSQVQEQSVKPVTEETEQIVEEQKQKGGNATYKDLAEYFEAQNGKPKDQTPPSGKDAPVFGSNDTTSIISKEGANGKYTSPEASNEIAKEMERLAGKSIE